MELRQLEYFIVVCEKGSFNRAAECLYTSQPNVSKVIHSLEKELGRSLFERSPRGLRITPYAEPSANTPASCSGIPRLSSRWRITAAGKNLRWRPIPAT